jgi:hypothetical protein
MRKTASMQRVARIHLARMNKRAFFMDNIQEGVVSSFLQSEASKEAKSISGEGQAGLKFLRKHFGLNSLESFIKAMEKSDYDESNPIQKMVAIAGSKAKSAGEAGDILGRFANAFQKQDIKGMAKATGFEEETVALVLLWYVRNEDKVQATSRYKEAFWNPFAVAPPPPPPFQAQALVVEKVLNLSGTVISQLSTLIGKGLGWLYSIIPQGWLPSLPAGKAWSAIYYIVGKAWALIAKAGGLALGLIKASIVKSTGAFGIVAVLKVLGVALIVYYALLGISWLSYQVTRLPSRVLVEFPLKVIWTLIKLIGKGVIKVTSWAYANIKSLISDNKDLLEPSDPMLLEMEAL